MRNRGPPLSTTSGPSFSEAGSFGGRGCGFSSSRSLHTERTSRAQDGVEVTGAQPFERTLPIETEIARKEEPRLRERRLVPKQRQDSREARDDAVLGELPR